MRLLLYTQVMDEEDLFSGFFVGWIREFSKHVDHIHVVCLKKGLYRVPENVSVHSLGKEEHVSRATYIVRFFVYLWRVRGAYDAVFVHQNQEYVLLGGLLWRALGVPVYMWRNHYAGNVFTDIAVLLSNKIFSTSRFSYTASYKKNVLMPVGVDRSIYYPGESVLRKSRSILFYARFAPSKRPHLLVEALSVLRERTVSFEADFYGTSLPKDELYKAKTVKRARECMVPARFHNGSPHTEGARIFSAHEIYVNASPSGMYDKTLFEAAACGCLVITASKDFANAAGAEFMFDENNVHDLAQKIEAFLNLSESEKESKRTLLENVAQENSLQVLAARLKEEMVL